MHECTASFLLYRFLQYMCWERGYDKDKLRKVIGSWKKHNRRRYPLRGTALDKGVYENHRCLFDFHGNHT